MFGNLRLPYTHAHTPNEQSGCVRLVAGTVHCIFVMTKTRHTSKPEYSEETKIRPLSVQATMCSGRRRTHTQPKKKNERGKKNTGERQSLAEHVYVLIIRGFICSIKCIRAIIRTKRHKQRLPYTPIRQIQASVSVLRRMHAIFFSLRPIHVMGGGRVCVCARCGARIKCIHHALMHNIRIISIYGFIALLYSLSVPVLVLFAVVYLLLHAKMHAAIFRLAALPECNYIACTIYIYIHCCGMDKRSRKQSNDSHSHKQHYNAARCRHSKEEKVHLDQRQRQPISLRDNNRCQSI